MAGDACSALGPVMRSAGALLSSPDAKSDIQRHQVLGEERKNETRVVLNSPRASKHRKRYARGWVTFSVLLYFRKAKTSQIEPVKSVLMGDPLESGNGREAGTFHEVTNLT